MVTKFVYFACFAFVIWLMRYSATPTSPRWWRMGRTVLALVAGYGITMIWVYVDYLYFHTIQQRGDVIWFTHGWWLTLTFIGWCEWRWRKAYRVYLLSLWRGIGDDPINNIVFLVSSIGTVLIVLFLSLVIAMSVTH
jgi:hypothetical protein